MSFMYKAMMARAPNKRKIKLNEQNLMQLMGNSDAEDEEDEDYTVSKEEEKNKEDDMGKESAESSEDDEADEDDTSGEESDDSEEEEDEDDQPQTSKRIRQSAKGLKNVTSGVTVKDVTEKVTSKYYGLPTSTQDMISQAKRYLFQSEQVVEGMKNLPDFVCGICLNQGSSSESSEFVTCKVCAISVHQSCYNMDHIVASRRSQDQWICDSCIHGGSDMVCQFCPNQFGCMKETKCGRWVHVVCSSPKKDVGRRSSVYIQLDELNRKQYGTKECMLCDDRLVAKTGICVKCDAGLCKASFHVTCAQKYGLLSRPQSSGDPCSSASNHGETYIVYCSLHSVEEQMKKRQKWFIIESKTMELRKQRLQDASEQEKDAVNARLKELRQHKERNQISYRPPRPPLEQVPRLLSSDAHFTRLLNRKAEKMFGITTEYPAMIIPKSTEIRKRHNVAPSLTTDFAAYFMDRELRLEEEKEHLSTSITVNQSLLEKEDDAKSRYNEIREKLIAAKNVKNDMKKEYESLKQLFNSIVDLAKVDELMKKGAKRRKSITPRKLSSPNEVTSPPLSPNSGKEPIPDADSIIDLKRCGICKGQEDQHLLVKCDVCLNWQHLGCLDPPLTQMPKRTKFALWQCSECANSSSSSSSESESTNRGSFICKDGRRATRRVRRVPEKLAIGFPDRRIRQTKEMTAKPRSAKEPDFVWM